MNEPKPYRPPVIRSASDGAITTSPEPPARVWDVATWLLIAAAIVLGSCGGALGSNLVWLLKDRL